MSDSKITIGSTHRDADEDIYLKENRTQRPKEIFLQVGNLLEAEQRPAGSRILDAGCATGELLAYLQGRFGTYRFAGYDISEKLIATAAERFPDIAFHVASLTDPDPANGKTYDAVLCAGVLGIFDDPQTILENLMSSLAPGGSLFIVNGFNEDPIDVLVRYKPAAAPDTPWQSGWNIFSIQTVERILSEIDPGIDMTWHPFRMPFAIPKTEDPMRSWTIETAEDPHQQTNGACQLRKVFILQARRSTR